MRDYGERHESGEKEPKGVDRSDTKGKRHEAVPKADKESGTRGASGEREPAGAKSRDASGELKRPLEGGVGMGKADSIGARETSHLGKHDGRLGEVKGHMGEKNVYAHAKKDYR